MGHCKNLGLTQIWLPWITKVGFMVLASCACMVTAEENIDDPLSGSMCISECATCPTICSTPPPSLVTTYSNHPPPSPLTPQSNIPPPPQHIITPSSYPPPPPLLTSYPSPPPLLTSNPPPPPLLRSYQPPPPLLISYDPPPSPLITYPPPTKPSQPPPKSNKPPFSGSGQPTVISGPNNYPYYYYYISAASSFQFHVIPFFLLGAFLHGVFF